MLKSVLFFLFVTFAIVGARLNHEEDGDHNQCHGVCTSCRATQSVDHCNSMIEKALEKNRHCEYCLELIGCEEDECPENFDCVEGDCVPATGCSSDDECPEYYMCSDGECVPQTCIENPDLCPEYYECDEEDAICVPMECPDYPCPDYYECDEDEGVCEPITMDCYTYDYCQQVPMACIALACEYGSVYTYCSCCPVCLVGPGGECGYGKPPCAEGYICRFDRNGGSDDCLTGVCVEEGTEEGCEVPPPVGPPPPPFPRPLPPIRPIFAPPPPRPVGGYGYGYGIGGGNGGGYAFGGRPLTVGAGAGAGAAAGAAAGAGAVGGAFAG